MGLATHATVELPTRCRSRAARVPTPVPAPEARPSRSDDAAEKSTALRLALSGCLSGGGRPLAADVLGEMQPRLGHDLGQVRIHDDHRAAESARLMGATAFTVGQHIVFGAAGYHPTSPAGRHLLAHELTHVVQQQGAAEVASSPSIDPLGPDLDDEADSVAATLRPPRIVGRAAVPTLQRQAGGIGYDVTLTYPPDHTETHRALAAAAALAVLTRFANRIEVHVEGASEGHRYLIQLHEDQWIVAGVSDLFSWQSLPDLEIWTWPRSLLRMARASIARGAVPQAARELQMAAEATRSAELRIHEYREGTISGAERAVFGLQVVEVASAAFVSAGTGGATGVLVGAGLTGAHRLAGEVTSVQLGLQREIDWAGISFDTLFAAVAGHFAGRLGSAIAGRLVARIGSHVAASAITGLVVGRATGIVHAATRELFDAARGRSTLTVEQFIDRLADQISLKAAFLDLVAYGAGSAGQAEATPEPGPPATTRSSAAGPPRLAVVQGGVPGRVPMRGGRVESVPSRGAPMIQGYTPGGGRSAGLAVEPLPMPEVEPNPSVWEVPEPVDVPSPSAGPANRSAPFSAVAVAAAAGPTSRSRRRDGERFRKRFFWDPVPRVGNAAVRGVLDQRKRHSLMHYEGHHAWPEYVGGAADQPLLGTRYAAHRFIHDSGTLHAAMAMSAATSGFVLSRTTLGNARFIARMRTDRAARDRFAAALGSYYAGLNLDTDPPMPATAYRPGIEHAYARV